MDSLHPRWRGGRPRAITAEMRAKIREVATTRPQLLGEPYARWSLSTLRAYLLKRRIVPELSEERLREILAEEGVSLQRTKSWKRSPDPETDEKAERIRRLYEDLPGHVVCTGEHGPIQPVPKPGLAWAPKGLPKRLPANNRKPHGVRFFFGAYDVGADQLFGRFFARKGSGPTLKFLKAVRARYPAGERIYLIMDNPSAHWTPEIRTWAEANDVELVPTPTYASWLNRIEAEVGVMVQRVFAGSDYRTHDEIRRAVHAYLRRRNAEARRHFDARQAEKRRRRERRGYLRPPALKAA